MIPYITTFDHVFFGILLYWLAIFMLFETNHLVAQVEDNIARYVVWSRFWSRWVTVGWVVVVGAAFFINVKAATTFAVWFLPMVIPFWIVGQFFKFLRIVAARKNRQRFFRGM